VCSLHEIVLQLRAANGMLAGHSAGRGCGSSLANARGCNARLSLRE
jgi:hypothetical protein